MLYFSNFCPICLIVNTLLSMHILMTSMYHILLVGHFAIVLVLQSIPICSWKHRKLISVYLAKKQNRRLDKLLYILSKIARDIRVV